MMFAIAIDLGGTKIQGCVVDGKGRILRTKRFATEAEKGKGQVIRNLASAIEFLKVGGKEKIKGVGISIPGLIDRRGMVVFGGGSLSCLVGTNLKIELERKVKLPVLLENDAKCFALAEAVYGTGKNYNTVVGVIWGTGIGSGIIINKRIYSGSLGGAGEIGHIVLEPNMHGGARCGCGQYGCLEMMASGKSIARRYLEKGGKISNPDVPSIYYKSKEAVAKEVIADAIHYLGLGLSIVVNIINPDIIILGGGVSKLPSEVYERLEKEIRKYALPILTKDFKLVRHKISDDAGVLGAAALVFGK